MAKCTRCGKDVAFVRRTGKKAIVVNSKAVYFLPDDNGLENFIHDGAFRRGTRAQDGLLGYSMHNCGA